MESSLLDDCYILPPGTLKEILSHPYYSDQRTIELSIFNDHRYAFFFWNKWTRELDLNEEPPCLVTLDWHQDLVFPDDQDKKWLSELNLSSNRDVAIFTWEKLRHLNDTHIMAAAYLNLVGDIFVQCRQGKFECDWDDEEFIDKYGNMHTIKKFKEYHELEQHLLGTNLEKVYFDIDLDFFTLNNPLQIGGGSGDYSYLSDKKIKQMLNQDAPLISWIFQRLQGLTIATEPEHTGGLLKSNKLLSLINKIWFDPSLFVSHPGNWDNNTQWKHLKK